MTSQNPASPNSPSSKLDRDILAKVNAHADRSMDRLFADIDELLNSDLAPDRHPTSSDNSPPPPHSTASSNSLPHQPDFTSSPGSQQPATSSPNHQHRRIPLWLKILLGVGVSSIAVGSILLWLIHERKIDLPKNLDTSWLPFQSQSQVSPADAKFAEYMRKSIAKIEAANIQPPIAANAPNPANNVVTTTPPAAPVTIDPNGSIPANTPNPATSTVAETPISLVQTLPTSNRPSAIFKINDRSQTVQVGQKIGTSKWSLLTVAKGEAIVKKVGGEIRSIYVGQKF